jgi:glucose/arabinose dehydrogenase
VSFLRRCLAAAVLVSVSMAALPGPAMAALGLDLVASSFTEPIFLTHAGDSRLFVVEQDGRIKIIGGGTFLDITGMTSKGGERGLLGLAFHPNYASPSLPGSGRFYVNYTRKSDGDTVIAEFKRSVTDPNKADPASKRIVMVINQPYPNHNGGWIGFKGNYLYIAMGDGGAGGDPGNRAQNLNSLLGKILRINPLDPDGGGPRKYSIPADNPFVGVAGKDQIWSYGLRNPWRCSFDREDGTLYCGDVGQGVYEEIDRASTGRAVNFGWRLLEGEHYYDWPGHSSGTVCTVDCKTLPVVEYSHSGVHCAVTGGYVSRRSGADLEGRYVFGDFCSGYVWTIAANAPVGTVGTLIENTSHSISSFGEGSDGKLYLVDLGGSIYRLTDS